MYEGYWKRYTYYSSNGFILNHDYENCLSTNVKIPEDAWFGNGIPHKSKGVEVYAKYFNMI